MIYVKKCTEAYIPDIVFVPPKVERSGAEGRGGGVEPNKEERRKSERRGVERSGVERRRG